MNHIRNRRYLTMILCTVLIGLCFFSTAVFYGPDTTESVSLSNSNIDLHLSYDEGLLKKAIYYTPDLMRINWVGKAALICFVLLDIIVLFLKRYESFTGILATVLALCGTLCIIGHALMLKALPLDTQAWQISMTPVPLVAALVGILLVLNLYGQQEKSQRFIIYLICTILSLLALIPFLSMVVNATRSTEEINRGISFVPSKYLQYNWQVLDRLSFDAVTGFSNSLLIAVSSTALTLYFSALTAYGFAGYRFSGRGFVFSCIIGSMMIPGMVGSIGYYQAIYRIGWTDSFMPLILPAIASSGTVFFFRQYLEANYHPEITEAARVDGSHEWHTFNVIILPMMGPVLAISGISSFVGAWNNYFTPLMLLSKPEKLTIPLMVQQLTGNDYRTEYGSLYLGLTLAALPLFVVYGILSRFIVRGVSLGAVKG